MIQLSNISKSFGTTAALCDVTLGLQRGERLAIVGENGAGKSSLMNVLYGLYRPDAGEVRLDGEQVRFRGPRDAIARGIGMVHQHFMLVPTLTVAENLVLGDEPGRFGSLDLRAARAEVERLGSELSFRLDPDAQVGTLTVGAQQRLEIAKALRKGATTLILDEPTAVLTPQEADELFSVTRTLSAAGRTVVFIGHKLKEVLAFATRIAVMRRGRLVGEVTPEQTSPEALAAMMVGQSVASAEWSRPVPRPTGQPSGPVLEVKGLCTAPRQGRRALAEVSLTLGPGEIVGLAGVDGNGQRELAEVLTGLLPSTAGEVLVAGQRLGADPAAARRLGVAHIPEDRLARAIVGPMSVEENLSLGRQGAPPFAKGPLVDFAGRRERALTLLRTWDVRPLDPEARMGELSGGNQQKAVVAREVDQHPRLLVAVQPTRGLDIAAVAQVRRQLLAERDRGCAVLLSSLDLDELLALADRIYVLFEGRIAGELERSAFDERKLGELMLGAREGAHG